MSYVVQLWTAELTVTCFKCPVQNTQLSHAPQIPTRRTLLFGQSILILVTKRDIELCDFSAQSYAVQRHYTNVEKG